MLCTAVFKETVSHFLENGSNVYACLLDASSAFDRVHYGKLFDVLMKRNMPAVFIRLLLDSYLNQRICAEWGACKSDFFQATIALNRAVKFRQYRSQFMLMSWLPGYKQAA